MWGLIEALILWNRKYRSVPLFILIGVLVALSILVEFPISKKPVQNLDMAPAPLVSVEPEKPVYNAAPVKKTEPVKLQKHLEEPEARATIDNIESMKNFSAFHDILTEALFEQGFTEQVGSNLAHKIKELLQNHEAGEEQLIATIRAELGPNAAPEEIEKVRIAIAQTVSDISDSAGPKPTPIEKE